MKRRVLRIWDLQSNGVCAALIVLAAMFLLGALMGCTIAAAIRSSGEDALKDFLNGYLFAISSEKIDKPGFFAIFIKALRWPAFTLCMGLTPFGLIGIPILFFVRAFLLSFTISSFYIFYGINGLIFAFALLGFVGLIYIPILFVFGIHCFMNSSLIVSRFVGENRNVSKINRAVFVRCCGCLLMLLLCSVFEYTVGAPILVTIAHVIMN